MTVLIALAAVRNFHSRANVAVLAKTVYDAKEAEQMLLLLSIIMNNKICILRLLVPNEFVSSWFDCDNHRATQQSNWNGHRGRRMNEGVNEGGKFYFHLRNGK